MKTKCTIRAAMLLLLTLPVTLLMATPGGSIMGRVTDPATNEPISDLPVVFEIQGNQQVFYTNDKGYYYAGNIAAGTYTIIISQMGHATRVENVKIKNDEQRELDLTLAISEGNQLLKGEEVVIDGSDMKKLIDPHNVEVKDYDLDDIKKQGTVQFKNIAENLPAIVEMDGSYFVHGARADGLLLYIDDCKVMGRADMPLSGVSSVKTYLNFIPVKYGDTTGGIMAVETRSWFTE